MPGKLPGHLQKATPILQLPTGSLPGQVFIQWLDNLCEAFYESPVIAYKAKEGSNLHVKVCSGAHSVIAFKFALLCQTPCFDTQCAK